MSKSNSLSKIRKAAERRQIAPTEYINYDDYMDAQKRLTKQLTSQPAQICEMCGYPMNYNGHKLSEWERKWSIHEVCKDKVSGMLDRKTGITRERKEAERIANRRRH